MGNRLGYVVIEYNQASHQPDVLNDSFSFELPYAEEFAQLERDRTAGYGRHETYTIAEVIELGDEVIELGDGDD